MCLTVLGTMHTDHYWCNIEYIVPGSKNGLLYDLTYVEAMICR